MTQSLRSSHGSDTTGPDVPMTKGRLGVVDLVKKTGKEIGADHVSAFAGNLTYHALLAIFPFAIFVLSVLFLAGQESLLTDGIASLKDNGALSPGAADVIMTQVTSLASSHSSAIGFGLVLSILTALWAISGAFRSIMEAMNVMYEVEETRGFAKKYLTSIVMSVIVAALFVVALGLMVGGPAFANTLGDVGKWAWLILQWPVMLALVLFGLALVYYFAPSVEQKFKWVTMGSIIATVMWLVFSIIFTIYVSNFGSYNKTYGTLAGVVILLLYMYYTSFIFLFGAEANQVIEDANPEGKNKGEKTA